MWLSWNFSVFYSFERVRFGNKMGKKRDFTERPTRGPGKSAKKQGIPEMAKLLSKSGECTIPNEGQGGWHIPGGGGFDFGPYLVDGFRLGVASMGG